MSKSEWAQCKADEIAASVATGRVWIDGELEFPSDCTAAQALVRLQRICEDCGGVAVRESKGRIGVFPPGLPVHVVLEWFEQPTLQKVEVHVEFSAYTDSANKRFESMRSEPRA